ncbi:hypothetical protein ACLI08_16310, partial [Flavobacterium sp. RNTU_13]|uniref:hypothetical protein n=1 Tax=Flavobacterium sp. RNTU_13 TaxID=3375145 RepID=UPI003988373D
MIKYYLLLFISIWHINIYANNHYASDPVHNTITALAPPANDLCANATQLTPGTACTYTSGTFSGALNDGGTSCVATASQDVWYKFTATDPTMKVTVPAIYDLNHAIQIFQGGCNGSLFACANTSGQNGTETVFRNDFIPGQEYYVRVINVFTLPSTFNFNICVTNYPTPANDLCANATQLTPGTACTYTAGTFSGALNDGGTSCVATASQDVWYKFTATDP